MKSLLLVACILSSLLLPRKLRAEPLFVNTTHQGAISALLIPETEVLLSVGQDGIMRRWDLMQSSPTGEIFLSETPPILVVSNSAAAQIAALSPQKGGEGYLLSAWNWRNGTNLFQTELPLLPTYLAYSKKGRILFYLQKETSGKQKVVMLDAQSGRRISSITGISSSSNFAYIGSTERILMVYGFEGLLSFWDIKTRQLRASIETIAGLEDLCVTLGKDKREMIARRGESIFLLDRRTGDPLHRIEVRGLQKIAVTEKGGLGILGQIASDSDRGEKLQGWTVNSSEIVPLEQQPPPAVPSRSLTAFVGGGAVPIFIADHQSRIFNTVQNGKRWEKFAENQLVNVTSLAHTSKGMAVLAEDRLLWILSPFFEAMEGEASLELLKMVNIRTYRKPFSRSERVRSLGEDLIIFGYGDRPSDQESFFIWSPSTETRISPQQTPMGGPLVDLLPLDPDGHLFAVWNKEGLFRIFDRDFLPLFSDHIEDIKSVWPLSDNQFLIGRNNPEEPLLLLDTTSSEKRAIPEKANTIFSVISAPPTNSLYLLKTRVREKRGRTFLERRSLPETATKLTRRTIRSVRGIDQKNSTLLWEPGRQRIYTTMGTRGVLRWDQRRLVSLAGREIVRDITLHKAILYTINQDGSLSIRAPKTDRPAVKLFFFKDESWAVVTQGKTDSLLRLSSPKAAKHIVRIDQTGQTP